MKNVIQSVLGILLLCGPACASAEQPSTFGMGVYLCNLMWSNQNMNSAADLVQAAGVA